MEIKKIEMKAPPVPTAPNSVASQVVTIECHYASSAWFISEIPPNVGFSALLNLISQKYHLDYCSLFLRQNSHYVSMTAEKLPGILRKLDGGIMRIYVAHAMKGRALL